MAPSTLDSRFTLTQAPPSDIDEIFRCLEAAFTSDEINTAVFKDCDKEEVHQTYMTYLAPRWLLPDIDIFKITDVASGRIAGWTALQFPWKDRQLTPEAKAMVESHDLFPAPKGTNMDAYPVLFECLSFASDHGYNPDKDYRKLDRKGTMIHPDFQKLGLGTALTKHCNAISDKTGGRTFVPARPTSIKMFNDNGFVTVGTHDGHLERWGGSRENSVTYMAIREAPSS